jgi:hypothetical protein
LNIAGNSALGHSGAHWSTPSKTTGSYGGGSSCSTSSPGGLAGSGGGAAIEYLPEASVPAPVAVTVGSVGATNTPAPNLPASELQVGGGGYVIVEEWS